MSEPTEEIKMADIKIQDEVPNDPLAILQAKRAAEQRQLDAARKEAEDRKRAEELERQRQREFEELARQEAAASETALSELEGDTAYVPTEVRSEDEVEVVQYERLPLIQPPKENAPDQRFVFLSLDEGCFDCNAWVPNGAFEGEKANCHFSKGINDHCPAQYFKAKYVGPVVLTVRKYRSLFKKTENNPQRRLRHLDELTEELRDNFSTDDMVEIMRQLGLM